MTHCNERPATKKFSICQHRNARQRAEPRAPGMTTIEKMLVATTQNSHYLEGYFCNASRSPSSDARWRELWARNGGNAGLALQ